MTATAYGDVAVRCVVNDVSEAHRLHAALMAARLTGVTNVVPAWRTVVVTLDDPQRTAQVLEFASTVDLAAVPVPEPRRHAFAVTYDGPDLDEVAGLTGMPAEEVLARHVEGDYVVAFLGFAPGFPYLTGLDPAIAVPRKATPRQRVPAGSVGIADDVTGIYPAASPGGWQIIGHVADVLFDPRRTPPALLAPGDHVRFVRAE